MSQLFHHQVDQFWYTMPGLGMNFLSFFLSTPEQRTIFSVKKKKQAIIYI